MKVKATVWLKDGNNATMMLSNTTLKAEAERYSEAMKYQVISHDGPTSIQPVSYTHLTLPTN